MKKLLLMAATLLLAACSTSHTLSPSPAAVAPSLEEVQATWETELGQYITEDQTPHNTEWNREVGRQWLAE